MVRRKSPVLAAAAVLAAASAVAVTSLSEPGAPPPTRSQPLTVGARAPDFTLPDRRGRKTSLAKLLETGPVAIVFYRGHW